jgi:DNA-binding transcriptional LysR family regulator
MDLRQLNYFAAVAEAKHLGRAAERLHLSQPPLTRQIQGLEDELGVQLFKRTPRGMDLTTAGQELLQHARAIGLMVAQATERTRRAGRGEAGRLDIGVYGSAMFGVVPKLLAAFRSTHPEVQVVLHHAQTPMQLPALRQKRVQLVFERLLPEEADVQVERVATEPVLLALSERHALAQRERIDIALLRDETILIGSSPSGGGTGGGAVPGARVRAADRTAPDGRRGGNLACGHQPGCHIRAGLDDQRAVSRDRVPAHRLQHPGDHGPALLLPARGGVSVACFDARDDPGAAGRLLGRRQLRGAASGRLRDATHPLARVHLAPLHEVDVRHLERVVRALIDPHELAVRERKLNLLDSQRPLMVVGWQKYASTSTCFVHQVNVRGAL